MASAAIVAAFQLNPGHSMEEVIPLVTKIREIGQGQGVQVVRLFTGFAGGGPKPFTAVTFYIEYADFGSLGTGTQGFLADPAWAPVVADLLAPDSPLEYMDTAIIMEVDF